MRAICLAIAACCGASAFAGNTCTWKSDALTSSADWAAATNYVEGVAPVGGNGDTIVIPLGKTVTLDASDAASRAIVEGGFATIKMVGRFGEAENPARMVVRVAKDDSDLTLNGSVLGYRKEGNLSSSDAYSGLVVKQGAGALKLKPTLGGSDYYTSFDVQEGDFYLPQDISAKSYYNEISISNNAILHVAAGTKKQDLLINKLMGEGIVTNTHANGFTDIHLYIQKECTFGGVIGNVRVTCKGGKLTLTGTNSTATSTLTADFNYSAGPTGSGGVVTFSKLGRNGQKSSLGTCQGFTFGGVGGAFVYAGAGEETDKHLRWQYPRSQMNYLSGGVHGGLVFDKDSVWNIAYTSGLDANGMASLGLSGDNVTNVCVMAGKIASSLDDLSNTNTLYITKFGAGTWRFKDHVTRTGLGGVAVREGTLQFDSLDEAGFASALGLATDVHTNYWGAYDATAKSDHVFELGGETTEGTLEFTGATAAYCTTRPAVLKGAARFRNSTAQAFRFAQVKNVSGKAQTLTLDGTGTGENVLADVADAANAPLSIVKEGSGTWTLANTNVALHGSLAVKGGTLKVRNPAGKYTWYLWHIRGVLFPDGDPTGEYASAGKPDVVQVEEFSFYRTNDYMRVNKNLTRQTDARAIQPGEVAYFDRRTYSGAGLANLFDGNASTRWETAVDKKVPRTDDPSSWCKVVQRLPADVDEVGGYDFQCWFGYPYSDMSCFNLFGRDPLSWNLSGSVDGIHWDSLHDITNALDKTGDMYVGPWSDRYYAAQSKDSSLQNCSTNSKHIVGHSTSTVNPIERVSSVSVASGATLEVEGDPLTVSGLTVDAEGMGTLKNFILAETGTLTVSNLSSRTGRNIELPGTYVNVTGLDNLKRWSLAGDALVLRKQIRIVDGKIVLVSRGFTIICR